MDTTVVLIIVVAAALVLGAVAFALLSRRRDTDLKVRFGPEYERAMNRAESKDAAEADLQQRLERREELDIHALSDPERQRFRVRWFELQKGFVDRPREAVIEADVLISEVMHDRGYPVSDFDRRADDISVDYPDIVDHYRNGHALAERSRDGLAGTEELREAVIYFRALFERLVGTEEKEEQAS